MRKLPHTLQPQVADGELSLTLDKGETVGLNDCLLEIRRQIEGLVAKRDARRDSFAEVLKDAMEIARAQGGFTIFALVDALTRLTQRFTFAADRAEADAKVARLLSLALAA